MPTDGRYPENAGAILRAMLVIGCLAQFNSPKAKGI